MTDNTSAAPTLKTVLSALSYDPETGIFTRRSTGRRVGCKNTNGHITIKIGACQYLAHLLAWLIVYGEWPVYLVDHRNRDRADNRISNLRKATHAQNCQNAGRRRDNTSGHKGVTWSQAHGKWRARCRTNGRMRHLGLFDTPEAAAAAYRAHASVMHGEFFNSGEAA